MIFDEKRKFIVTEPIKKEKEYIFKRVWDSVKNCFSDRVSISYWKYPLFSQIGQSQKEPDILIGDKKIGLIVINVKETTVENLKLDKSVLDKYVKEIKQHLIAAISRCDSNLNLYRKVKGKAFIALPLISKKDIEEGINVEFPILFKEDLGKMSLLNRINNQEAFVEGNELGEEEWRELLITLSGAQIFTRDTESENYDINTRKGIIKKIRNQMNDIDLQQEQIGKVIPPGPQRIRGIAGSGKTVLICQKAAHMHLKHPDWKIAVVFFTRSLYENITSLIDKWMRHFTLGKMGFDPDKNENLVVLHAWGAKERKGFYGEVCNLNNKKRKTVKDVPKNLGLKPNEGLGYLCSDLLEDLECDIVPCFDAILIDEGQDLVVDNEILKYDEKQPIYWLAYKSLKSFDEEQPELKRLIWAYDEGQSLDNLSIPKASELFGDNPELKNLVTGIYPGGIRKSEIMYRCYRTPREILTSAHAIGMGLLREEGMLRGFTNKDDWEKVGYIIENGIFKSGQEIELYRPEENSPNLTSKYWKGDIIKFETFDSREEELENLAEKIKYNIEMEGLNPSREILVIILGDKKDAPKLEQEVASYLIRKGIEVYIPTAKENNVINPQYPNQDKDKFWNDGGVTVSRIHRAKGNEAEMVYVVGFDKIAQDEGDINLRNQVFVALTRARCWVNLSGIKEYQMYDEMRNVIISNGRFKFIFKRPPKFDVGEEVEDIV